jgi:TolB-like protein/Tfp pilus assembly protein PilF
MPTANVQPQKATSHVLRYGFLLVGVAAALGLAVKVQHWRSLAKSARGIHAIVVLPLRNRGGEADQYLADGITEEFISDLGQISSLRVISGTSARRLRQTDRSIPEIARQLGADGVVDGSVVRDGNQVRISAELSDGKSGRQLWKREYSGQLSASLQLASNIAHDIARKTETEVKSPERAGAATVHPTDPAAQDLYLQGEYFLNRGGFFNQGAIGYFQKAIEKDPSFAPAYAGLAATYWSLGEYGLLEYSKAYSQAEVAARKAIELDKSLAEGHAVLAQTLMDSDWDWTAAEIEFRRALELNPSSSATRFAYAHYLTKMGRAQEAISEAETGLKLDPMSPRGYDRVAHAYYFSRQYDRALESVRGAAELYFKSPDNPLYWDLAVVYVEKGNLQKAIDQFRAIGDLPHVLGHLGNAYARAGEIENANQMIARLRVHVKKEGLGAYEIALVYAGLGNKDEAFAWLEKSFPVRDKGLTFLKVDPCVDPLRSDPRFQNLLRRVGLAG